MSRPKKARYGVWKGLSRDMIQIAKDRTSHLLDNHPLAVQSYQNAIANAYLCGIADAAEAMKGTAE